MDHNTTDVDASVHFLESSRFWIQRVLVPIIVLIGVGGNTVSVMVLTRKRMRCSTNVYLTALAIADVIYLLFVLLLSLQHYPNIKDRKYELFWRFFGLTHWLCDAASSTSVWLTVSFTLERYIAVCHPIKGKVVCTENRAKSITVIVTILCILSTASTAFEYQLALNEKCIKKCSDQNSTAMEASPGNSSSENITIHFLPNKNIVVTSIENSELGYDHTKLANEVYSKLKSQLYNINVAINCTSHPHIIYLPIYSVNLEKFNRSLIEGSSSTQNETNYNETANFNDTDTENVTCCVKQRTVDIEGTNLGNNEFYRTAIGWFSAIFFALLPLLLLATFNCFLIYAVYTSQIRRRKMTNSQLIQENSSTANENRITLMLIGVVVLFLICQTPTASFLIYDNFDAESKNGPSSNIKRGLGNIFNFLLTLNAAGNFLLYCVLSKKYRATFREIFWIARKKKRQDTIELTSTRNSQRFNPFSTGLRRNISEYHTPRNLETTSLTSIPRSKSLMVRSPGKSKSTDLIV